MYIWPESCYFTFNPPTQRLTDDLWSSSFFFFFLSVEKWSCVSLLGCRSSPPPCPASVQFFSPPLRLGEAGAIWAGRLCAECAKESRRADGTTWNKAFDARSGLGIWRPRDNVKTCSCQQCWRTLSARTGKMARTQTRMLLALVALLGIFLLHASVKGEQQEAEEQQEEERSCQGAFDLYFVLDKWVSRVIYGFVRFSSLLIAMRPRWCLENSERVGVLVWQHEEEKLSGVLVDENICPDFVVDDVFF